MVCHSSFPKPCWSFLSKGLPRPSFAQDPLHSLNSILTVSGSISDSIEFLSKLSLHLNSFSISRRPLFFKCSSNMSIIWNSTWSFYFNNKSPRCLSTKDGERGIIPWVPTVIYWVAGTILYFRPSLQMRCYYLHLNVQDR